MKIVTAAEIREIDRITSERYGVPSLALMEAAGTAVADYARARWPQASRVVIVCGKGNNGGDGFVAARKLHEARVPVAVLLLAEPAELKGDAATMYKRLRQPAKIIHSEGDLTAELKSADLIVDAVLGTGLQPPARGLAAAAIRLMSQASAPVLAVDIPSGADSDSFQPQPGEGIARANAIVTFTAPRPAHLFGDLTTGPVLVAPIGSPGEAIVSALNLEVTTATDVVPLLAPREPEANKGRFGHVLVVGGSVGKAGAAAMSGVAALRSGAGLVTVATPLSVLPTVAGFAPEIMTAALAETAEGTAACELDAAEALLENKTVLAIGPGLSRHAESAALVRSLVKRQHMPIVLDADGLNAFEGHLRELRSVSGLPLVVTPHPGEMARVIGSAVAEVQRDRLACAREHAKRWQAIVVLKGHRTVIAMPDGRAWVNATGNPGMASGGMGDILTGMIAGMLAQFTKQPEAAVCAAVYLHGAAGDAARAQMGEQSLIATDLLRCLPQAMRRTRHLARVLPVHIG